MRKKEKKKKVGKKRHLKSSFDPILFINTVKYRIKVGKF